MEIPVLSEEGKALADAAFHAASSFATARYLARRPLPDSVRTAIAKTEEAFCHKIALLGLDSGVTLNELAGLAHGVAHRVWQLIQENPSHAGHLNALVVICEMAVQDCMAQMSGLGDEPVASRWPSDAA